MNKRGILTVISGFSGAGKGTVVKKLLESYDNYALSISATTRLPREGEEEGVAYFFKTKETFEQMIEEDRFIEYACYVGNYYGTPRDYVEQQLENGKDVILEIELQGALAVQKQYPQAVLIFIMPPTAKELERRLTTRGTEDAKTIARRMARASEESAYMPQYDYLVINDTVDACVLDIHQIVQTAHKEAKENEALIESMQEQLKEFSKGE